MNNYPFFQTQKIPQRFKNDRIYQTKRDLDEGFFPWSLIVTGINTTRSRRTDDPQLTRLFHGRSKIRSCRTDDRLLTQRRSNISPGPVVGKTTVNRT